VRRSSAVSSNGLLWRILGMLRSVTSATAEVQDFFRDTTLGKPN
jgi:hypothetical protein